MGKTWYSRAKKLALFFNTGLTLAGVGLGVISLVFILNESRPELTPREMLWSGLGTAFVIVLTGILGMMCNMKVAEPSQQRSAFKCYLILAAIVAGIMGGALRYSKVSTKGDVNTSNMSRIWNKLPDETALAIQSMGQCCGFSNYTDRIQEPCIRYIEKVGCGQIMTRYYRRSVYKLVPIVWIFLSAALAAIASGTLLWLWGERLWAYGPEPSISSSPKNNNAQYPPYTDPLPGTPKGQSYDEWHRTVFQ